jgi:beta-glucosidase
MPSSSFNFCASLIILFTTSLPALSFASCNYTIKPNVDFNGGDLPNQPVSKTLSHAAECGALCCSTPNCAAFSLNGGGGGTRWCYLKNADGWTSGQSQGCDSGCLGGGTGECAAPPPPGVIFPWFNLSLPRADRIAALIANMTLNETISWLNDDCPAMPRLGVPSMEWEAEALHGVSWAGVATIFPENIAWGATFDVPLISQVADVIATEARAKYNANMNSEGSGSYLSFMTPNNNLFLDARWGRGQETYGEDPVLTSAITAALIRGLQEAPADSPPSPYKRLIATSKHWLAYHIESFDGDGQFRLSHSFNLSDTDIQQYYILPFAAAVSAGVGAVMCDYSGANGTLSAWPHPGGKEKWGVPSCLHDNMAELLRGQLGFQGYVISDEGAITFASGGYHDFTTSMLDSACLAMNAGTDLALGGEYHSTLYSCVNRGNMTLATLQRALTRTLTALFDTGFFDTIAAIQQGIDDPVARWNNVSDADVATNASLALAQQVASESFVLLKNEGALLPISPKRGSIVALIGPAGVDSNTSISQYIGNYAGCEDGPGGSRPSDTRCGVSSLLDALLVASQAGGWTLRYAPGASVNIVNTSGFAAALDAVTGADIVIFAGGIDTSQEAKSTEGEANDRAVDGGQYPEAGLDLGGSQPDLLLAIAKSVPNVPLIALFFNGGPISSPVAFQYADAILEVWYPGIRGGAAIVDALLGITVPAGRMPVMTVQSLSDLPYYLDTVLSTPPGRTHMYFTGTPLRPFGFGLSYANFDYTGLSISPTVLSASDETFTVSAMLSHSGGVSTAADEVTLLFGSFDGPSVGAASVPLLQLLAFTRTHALAEGDSHNVSFVVNRTALALVAPSGGLPVVSSGNWSLWIGGGPPNNVQFGGGQVLQGWMQVLG